MKWGTLRGPAVRKKECRPYNSPVHAGGILSMKKWYYYTLLGYDKAIWRDKNTLNFIIIISSINNL